MMNVELLWWFILPLVLSLALFFILPQLSSLRVTPLQSLGISAGAFAVACLIFTCSFYMGKGSKTADLEVWNGSIVSKSRTQGTYVESYQCNCRTVSSGSGKNQTTSTVCDTCYRNHWTVSWDCRSNIGSFNIDERDWTNPGVWLLPDPPRYTIIQKGDPVSAVHEYTNYIKAVPNTLFRPAQASLKAKFAGQIPEYPIQIYDIYHINRVIPIGVNIFNVGEWNDKLSRSLATLGPAKQANAVVVITKSADPDFFYALQDAWLNGKKNDIVIVIGAPEFPKKAAWVKIMALTQDDIFQVKMRDDILALDELTADGVVGALNNEVLSTFKRKHMKDFQYLDAEIDPPEWVMVSTAVLIFALYFGFVAFNFNRRS